MAKRTRDQEEEAQDVSLKKKPVLSKNQIIEAIANQRSTSDEDQSDSDELDESEEELEEEQLQQQSSSKKQNNKNLSAQEVQVARETAELFKSNIFKLQIDELIKEVKLKDVKITKIEKFLHKLYELIQEVAELKNQTIDQVESWASKKKVAIPFNDPKPTKVNYKFGYAKPENVSIVGSFGLKTGIQSPHGLSVDVNVTMPNELFQSKDYLNYRALHKRSFYLGYLTDSLKAKFQKEGLDFINLSYTYLNDDILTPILKIEATNKDLNSEYNFYKTKFAVNILIGFPFRVFDAKKLLPNKNCIRVQKDEDLELPSTPLYNASILTMTSYDHYLKYLYKSKKAAEQFKEACILGRIWLSQRGLDSSIQHGGFGHFEFAALIAALLNGGGNQGNKILLHGFSSYQLFKGAIKYLATEDLCTDGYLQFYSDSSDVSRYIKGGFNTPSIFDKTTKINLLHKVTKHSYSLLVEHAKKTLILLNDVIQDRFDALFLRNSNIDYLKYDYQLQFQLDINDDSTFGPFEKITYLTYENYISSKIAQILEFGLGDRLNGFNISFKKGNSFEISKRKAASSNLLNVKIGLLAKATELEKLVTKGPLESDDSSKFRAFWGPKSSLRRFKDGTITHSVVWSTDFKEPVILQAIDYLFKRHINEALNIESIDSKFNELLPLPNLPSSTKQSTVSTIAYNGLMKSYDDLYRILSKLDLPLSIKSILPTSSALRYTSYLQPVPYSISSKDFFNELILQFETSVKWPDEISALEKVKTAFLIKISEILTKETAYKSYITKDEDTIPYNFDISILNILTPEGYGFKVRILTERDEVLYLRAIENSRKDKKSELESIYLKFNQKYLGSVVHTRSISTISHQFPFYSPTVRLFKKWLDDQLLLSHFNEELIELIALQPFVDPAQYEVPSSVVNGFLKILNFLSHWNWREDPLILDLSKRTDEDEDSEILAKLSDRLTVQSYQLMRSNFESIRKQDPQGFKTQFFVATKADASGILWSSGIPLPIAARLTALSKVATQLVNTNGLNNRTLGLLFTPSLGDYDFVVKVKTLPLGLGSGVLTNTSTFRNLMNDTQSYPSDIFAKFDTTLRLARDLKLKYHNNIIFSHKSYNINEKGENVLTGIFIPNVLQKSKFKVQLGYNFKPESKDDVVINKEAIFNEILDFAGDLVQGFEANK